MSGSPSWRDTAAPSVFRFEAVLRPADLEAVLLLGRLAAFPRARWPGRHDTDAEQEAP